MAELLTNKDLAADIPFGIVFLKGDIWKANATIRVNPVNCVGTMGKGLALDFKRRYPLMYHRYRALCAAGEIEPGWMDIHFDPITETTIINFPTKRHYRESSNYEDIETGLADLNRCLRNRPSTTVAIPALGCGNGALDWARVKPMISAALGELKHKLLVFEPQE